MISRESRMRLGCLPTTPIPSDGQSQISPRGSKRERERERGEGKNVVAFTSRCKPPRKGRKQYRREGDIRIEDADAFRAAGDSTTDFPHSRTPPLCHLPTTCGLCVHFTIFAVSTVSQMLQRAHRQTALPILPKNSAESDARQRR